MTVSETRGDSFTVSLGGRVVDIFHNDNRYWCNFKPTKKGNAITSCGIADKDTAIQWAARILHQWEDRP